MNLQDQNVAFGPNSRVFRNKFGEVVWFIEAVFGRSSQRTSSINKSKTGPLVVHHTIWTFYIDQISRLKNPQVSLVMARTKQTVSVIV